MKYRTLIGFVLPLAVMSILKDVGEQLQNVGLARSPDSTNTIAAFGVAWFIIKFLGAPFEQAKQLSLTLCAGQRSFRKTLVFVLVFSVSLTLILALIGTAPFGRSMLAKMHGIDDMELVKNIQFTLRALCVTPVIFAVLDLLRGLLIRAHCTIWVSAASVVEVIVLFTTVTSLLSAEFVERQPLLLPITSVLCAKTSTFIVLLVGCCARVSLTPAPPAAATALPHPSAVASASANADTVTDSKLAAAEEPAQDRGVALPPSTSSSSSSIAVSAPVAAYRDSSPQRRVAAAIPSVELISVRPAPAPAAHTAHMDSKEMERVGVGATALQLHESAHVTSECERKVLPSAAIATAENAVVNRSVTVLTTTRTTTLRPSDDQTVSTDSSLSSSSAESISTSSQQPSAPTQQLDQPKSRRDSVHNNAATDAKLTYCDIVCFFWPVTIIQLAMGVSRPLINIFASQQSTHEGGATALAALSVSYSFGRVFYGWLNECRNLPVAFKNDSEGLSAALARIRRFCAGCCALSVAATSLLAWIEPLRTAILEGAIGVKHEVAILCATPLIIFTFFPLAVAPRAYNHGLSYLYRRTQATAASGPLRLVAIVVMCVTLAALDVEPVSLGISALFSGFAVESISVFCGVHVCARGRSGRDDSEDGHAAEREPARCGGLCECFGLCSSCSTCRGGGPPSDLSLAAMWYGTADWNHAAAGASPAMIDSAESEWESEEEDHPSGLGRRPRAIVVTM